MLNVVGVYVQVKALPDPDGSRWRVMGSQSFSAQFRVKPPITVWVSNISQIESTIVAPTLPELYLRTGQYSNLHYGIGSHCD
jgi:hypothetical protein